MQGVEPQLAVPEALRTGEAPEECIRSLRSKLTAWVLFKNATKKCVDIFWLDYLGTKVLYHTLKPGGKCWQHTFETHPWIACKYDSEELLTINKRLVHIPSQSGLFEVDIQEPACLPWSQETHTRYVASFKGAVKELLLSHSQRRGQQPDAQSGVLRRSARLEAKRLHKESDPLGMSLAALPPELLPKIVQAMAPEGVLNLEHVPGEDTLPGYDKMHIPE